MRHINNFIHAASCSHESIRQRMLDVLQTGSYYRPHSTHHFCVYFAGVDFAQEKVFLGHHKKANLWLFNGGHLDEGETPAQALEREIGEEWGLGMQELTIRPEHYLTITPIDNPKQPHCSSHYDLWHFIALDSTTFYPDMEKVLREFHALKWLGFDEARQISEDKNTREVVQWLATLS